DDVVTRNFNINILLKSQNSYNLGSMMKSLGLKQVIKDPTRESDNSSTLIDHLYVPVNSKFVHNGVHKINLSDHHMIYTVRANIYNEKMEPIKKIKIKNRSKPWFGQEIQSLIKEKDRLYKKFLKNRRNAEIKRKYKLARNNLNLLCRKAKHNYFNQELEKSKKSSTNMWKVMDNLVNYKSNNRCKNILSLEKDGKTISELNEIQKELAETFTYN